MMRRIDLLPDRYAARRKERRTIGAVVVAALLVILLLFAYWLVLGGQISSEENELRAAQQRNAALQSQIDELQVFAALEAEVVAKRTALVTVMNGDIAWPALLTEIAMVIPGEVWLTELTASAGATEGSAPVGTETAPIRISDELAAGRIEFAGRSLTMPGVAKWLIRQGSVDKFSAVWLNTAATEEGGEAGGPVTIAFDSTLELSPEALSQRFLRELP